jgi:hypothetical protein
MGEWKYSYIFSLDTRSRLVRSFTSLPLYTAERSPRTPRLEVWLGHHWRARHCREEKYLLSLPAIEPDFPIRQAHSQPFHGLHKFSCNLFLLSICYRCFNKNTQMRYLILSSILPACTLITTDKANC